jgi:superfamily II DNA or RNA helicase
MPLRPGLYDQPVTMGLARELEEIDDALKRIETADLARSPVAFSRALTERLVRVLESLPAETRLAAQVDLVNELFARLQAVTPGVVTEDDRLAPEGQMLRAVLAPTPPPREPTPPPYPALPLGESGLLVNGRRDLSIGPAIRREIGSSDRVDLLCSFLKWSGLRLVHEELRALCKRGVLRVLTTAYMSATERRALDALVEMGAQLRVSYDTQRTRLHAKAWLFHRDSGFSTATIGSSNLSHAAMLDGVEWNVRVSQVDNAAILDKFRVTFEQYWEDSAFAPYDPDEFVAAVSRDKRQRLAPYLRLDIEPRPHQREILDALTAERERGHLRNLVVAATGTGKTIVAALDYKSLRQQLERVRLLFVAHRREILEQSLATFRTVLRDGSFGEALHSSDAPTHYEHVFASVQSLHETRLAQIPADHFDVVIVDEFHHAAAPTYERLLEHVQPQVLLGLTATPERTDGRDVLHWFDGRVASELRLWKALDQDLLSPFQYFGLGGGPDVSGVKWSGGRYVTSELSGVYTADHFFAKRVIQETAAKVADVHRMRALGFCVDIAHAEFMARQFVAAGIPAAAVSARTKSVERGAVLRALEAGDLKAVFSVDLFNEGVDLPNVDTILFLRPTESATVFLQQLGRGLRRSSTKECCTVLDFIGRAHRKFRFDARFRALVGGTRKSIERQIREGFPQLPSGCVIQLDRQAEDAVLENLRQAIGRGRDHLVEDLRQLGDVSLAAFLTEGGYELEDVYDGRGSMSELRRRAGFELGDADREEAVIERAFGRLLHLDDFDRLDGFLAMLDGPFAADEGDAFQRMLFTLLGQTGSFRAMQPTWDRLRERPWVRRELRELLAVLADRCRHLTHASATDPLRVHATYTRLEIMAAFDERTAKGGVKKTQTGVYHLADRATELLFVTLQKSERGFTATTMYRDYPLSPTHFHWESQSTCHAGTPTGRRYLEVGRGTQRALLLVRERQRDDRGVAVPYVNLGEVIYRGHEGGRPMRIEWELARPMPPDLYQEAKLAAG